MEKLDFFLELIKLEKRYRKIYTGIEDDIESYYKDGVIFPSWWFSSGDYELKINLISKALKNNMLLTESNDIEKKEDIKPSIKLEKKLKIKNA